MTEKKSEAQQPEAPPYGLPSEHKDWEYSDLEKRPEVVLSLLEPDQLVATKEHTRFGLRSLSVGTRVQLWALRIYVVVMMIIVALSVFRAIQAAR